MLAQRAPQQHLDRGDEGVDLHRLGVERLAAGEGEQPVGERRRPVRRLRRDADEPLQPAGLAPGEALAQQFQAALDPLQEIVEIMGDTAGELAHRFHLLGLAQLLLRLALGADIAPDHINIAVLRVG